MEDVAYVNAIEMACEQGRILSYNPGHDRSGSRAPMTGWERARRDAEIVAERSRGRSWSSISTTAGVSARHCRRVVAEYRESGVELEQLEPLDVVQTMYRRYEAAISELEEISETAKNESARVGAVKARVEVIRTECDLLQNVGILPPDLGLVRNERDLRSIVAEIVMLFDKYSLPVEAQKELLETTSQLRQRVD